MPYKLGILSIHDGGLHVYDVVAESKWEIAMNLKLGGQVAVHNLVSYYSKVEDTAQGLL